MKKGFTLVEIVVAVGVFSIIMLLASGAYFLMISVNRSVQGTATGIDSLSFALETMTRTIRTGTNYGCPSAGSDCTGGTSFSVTNSNGVPVAYSLSNESIIQNNVALTDPSLVKISSLRFYVTGTSGTDTNPPHVTMVVTGTVASNTSTSPQSFTVQTGATMRGIDPGVITSASSQTSPYITNSPGAEAWQVPPGVTSVTIKIWGAGGGGGGGGDPTGPGTSGGNGGGGGCAQVTSMAVTPGELLGLYVGGGGGKGSLTSGTSGNRTGTGGGGGGYTAIMRGATEVLTAPGGGGGGGGDNTNGATGGAGGAGGVNGSASGGLSPGNGGTKGLSTSGGTAGTLLGTQGTNGAVFQGGNGGNVDSTGTQGTAGTAGINGGGTGGQTNSTTGGRGGGGGGGGGHYGGGGGGAPSGGNTAAGGGGGGSGYLNGSYLGWFNNGSGRSACNTTDTYYSNSAGQGGTGGAVGGNGTDGNPGLIVITWS